MSSAVLDTNAIASGLAGFARPSSTPGSLLRAWRTGAFTLVTSEVILAELARTLAKPYFARYLTAEQATRAIDLLRLEATLTPITMQVSGVATHPEDDLILATAASGRADYLVTGDRQLRRLGSFQGTIILSPGNFQNLLNTP